MKLLKQQKASTFKLEKFENGTHYILLNKKDVSQLTKNKNKRVICRINNLVEFHGAILPKKEGGHFITIGSVTCKKLKIKEGVFVEASFRVDETEFQFEMPIELQEVMQTDSTAQAVFNSLTKGNQRGLIYLVTLLKTSNKRIERALKIAEKIKAGITSPRLILKP